MASFIEFLQNNPLYIAGIVLLIVFIIISLLKKAVKLLVLVVILIVAYSYYLNDSFDSYQISVDPLQSFENKASELIDKAKG